jgi:hypothetical protein
MSCTSSIIYGMRTYVDIAALVLGIRSAGVVGIAIT